MMGQQPCCPILLSFSHPRICTNPCSCFPIALFRAVSTHAKPTKSAIYLVFSAVLNWHRNCYLPDKVNKETFIVVPRIFQQTFLKMNRFAFALHLAFIASILVAGCTAPAHLRHRSHPSTSELSPDEKMQQTIGRWKGVHISKAIQKWGSPKEVNDDGTGWHIYIWQVPVQMFLSPQQHRVFSRRHANGLNGVAGTILQTDYAYELVFYTRPDGIIDKTLAKRSQNSSSKSVNWR